MSVVVVDSSKVFCFFFFSLSGKSIRSLLSLPSNCSLLLTCFLQSTPFNGMSVHEVGAGAGLGAARAGEEAASRTRRESAAAAASGAALLLFSAAMVAWGNSEKRPFSEPYPPFSPDSR